MDPFGLLPSAAAPVLGSAIVLGLVHGAEPGHGWPIAAAYALDREPKWGHGLVASVLLGLGHLVSSLAVVAVFFLAKTALNLERLNDPLHVLGVPIGGPVGVVAGVLLVGLGVREYRRSDGHGHTHAGPGHSHEHPHDHEHDHSHEPPLRPGHELTREPEDGLLTRVKARLPGGGHDHPTPDDLDRQGLTGLVWTAFVLGFVHEEEFEIIGLCLGSSVCLELMLVYALAVLVALVGLTMALIAGYYRYEDRVERYAGHFPTVSAAVLVVMGLGFALGLV